MEDSEDSRPVQQPRLAQSDVTASPSSTMGEVSEDPSSTELSNPPQNDATASPSRTMEQASEDLSSTEQSNVTQNDATASSSDGMIGPVSRDWVSIEQSDLAQYEPDVTASPSRAMTEQVSKDLVPSNRPELAQTHATAPPALAATGQPSDALTPIDQLDLVPSDATIPASKTMKGRLGGWRTKSKALTALTGGHNTAHSDTEAPQKHDRSSQETRQKLNPLGEEKAKGRFGGWLDKAKALSSEQQNTAHTDGEASQNNDSSLQEARPKLDPLVEEKTIRKGRIGAYFAKGKLTEEQRDVAFQETQRKLEALINDATKKDQSGRILFLPRGEARRIFMQEHKLVKYLGRYSMQDVRSKDKDKEDLFYKAVTAPDVKPEECEQARSNILATLLSNIEGPRANVWQRFLTLCLSCEENKPDTIPEQGKASIENVCTTMPSVIKDRDLPLTKDTIEEVFGRHMIETFSQQQGRYCPIVLEENKLIEVDESRTVPFMRKELLGAGSGGKVFRVAVARSHFKSKKYGFFTSNEGEIDVAEKVMQANDRSRTTQHKDEWNTVQWFLQNATQHRGIVAAFASIDRGTELSIISEYARYGDLWEYMTGPGNDNHRFEDPKWRQHVLEQMRDVADGINHMHSGLMDKADRIMCFHMDLKPSNILIMQDDHRSESGYDLIFKIADFGISGISRRKEKSEFDEFRVSPFAKQDHPATHGNRASRRFGSLTNKRGNLEDCYAPELLEVGARASDKVDIWAYGCILAMVMTWLYGGNGPHGIDKYRNHRAEKNQQISRDGLPWFFVHIDPQSETAPPGDYFAGEIETLKGSELRHMYLNPSVEEWHLRLHQHTQDQPDHFMLDTVNKLLCKRILVPDPTKRCHARELFQHMGKVVNSLLAGRDLFAPDTPRLDHTTTAAVENRRASEPSALRSPSPGPPVHGVTRRHTDTQPTAKAFAANKSDQIGEDLEIWSASASKYASIKLQATLKSEARKCSLSPDGLKVGFLGKQGTIALVRLNEHLITHGSSKSLGVVSIDGGRSDWIMIALSNDHICAVDGSLPYGCLSLYSLAPDQAWVDVKRIVPGAEKASILKLAISADCSTIAYAGKDMSEGSLAVFYIGKYGTPNAAYDLVASGRASPTRLPLRFERSDQVSDLRYSDDSRYLSIVIQKSTQQLVAVYTWDFKYQRACKTYETSTSGDFAGSGRPQYSSMLHLPNEPTFIIILQHSGVRAFNFRRGTSQRLASADRSGCERYTMCLMPADATVMLVGQMGGGFKVGVYEYISYVGNRHLRSRYVSSSTSKMNRFEPQVDSSAISKLANGELRLVLCRTNGTIETLELTQGISRSGSTLSV